MAREYMGLTYTGHCSTIRDPFNGSHPVSGTRTFGIYTNFDTTGVSGHTFYIQGADRILSRPGEMIGSLLNLSTSPAQAFQFEKADSSWKDLINNVAKFANNPNKGGQVGAAVVNRAITNRPNWTDVYNALKNHQPLKSVPCD